MDRQFTLADAFKQRDEAMQRIEVKAEEVLPLFKERASEFVLQYLHVHGPTSSEVLTEACCDNGIQPHDDRAFGPIYMTLSRRQLIHKIGTCKRKRGHGTAGGNVWALQ